MANMHKFARWHIWMGWLVGVPILMWTLTGLIMVAKPIEEVRGDHLRAEVAVQALPTVNPVPITLPADSPQQYREMRSVMQQGRAVWLLATMDGAIERYPADSDASALPPVNEAYVRRELADKIIGGDALTSLRLMNADEPASDFRRAIPAWQATLENGARIYVDARTGEIAAVRTSYWRVFDFAWGLHIMDLQTREDTSHPILILFAALGVLGSLLGCILMFRRRKRRVSA